MNQARAEYPVTVVIAKEGELCWLGHLDFARAVERALRRSGLPLSFTEGFHKRPKMRLPEPLPLGVGSEGERFVVPLAEERGAEQVAAALAGKFPRGLRIVEVRVGSWPEPLDVAVELELEAEPAGSLAAALAALQSSLPAIGGTWRRVDATNAGGESPSVAASPVVVRLEPPRGGRVSAGRFLELLKQGAPSGCALTRIHRRVALGVGPVAWQAEGSSLPSSPLPPGR
jgi:hypothetical protein